MKNKKVEEKRTSDKKESLPAEKNQTKNPILVRFVAFILRWL